MTWFLLAVIPIMLPLLLIELSDKASMVDLHVEGWGSRDPPPYPMHSVGILRVPNAK